VFIGEVKKLLLISWAWKVCGSSGGWQNLNNSWTFDKYILYCNNYFLLFTFYFLLDKDCKRKKIDPDIHTSGDCVRMRSCLSECGFVLPPPRSQLDHLHGELWRRRGGGCRSGSGAENRSLKCVM
jgi:hypothetical protein